MAQYNDSISITFNDNDGGVGWRLNPTTAYDVARYQRVFGVWRTRWIFFKKFWRALKIMESSFAKMHLETKPKLWVFKAEIPE